MSYFFNIQYNLSRNDFIFRDQSKASPRHSSHTYTDFIGVLFNPVIERKDRLVMMKNI